MMIDLLIVTGGSKGIGRNIVTNSSSYAKKILAIGSSDSIKGISCKEKNIFSIKKDLSKIENNLDELNDFLVEHKPVSVGIVMCASSIGSHGGILEANLSEWDYLYKLNVLGNLSVLKSVLMHIKKTSLIRAVFFAGGGAAYGYPEFSGYSLSKVAVVRAVENIGIEFNKKYKDASIVALAPGAVATEMLAVVESFGAEIKTRTSINEPTDFVSKFIQDKIPSKKINGCFIHVRDELDKYFLHDLDDDLYKLRRID